MSPQRAKGGVWVVLLVALAGGITSVILALDVGGDTSAIRKSQAQSDRGQAVANCTGTMADYGQEWAGIANVEIIGALDLLTQDRVAAIDLGEALTASENVKELAQMRREVRAEADRLIDAGETDFDCPAIPGRLTPPT